MIEPKGKNIGPGWCRCCQESDSEGDDQASLSRRKRARLGDTEQEYSLALDANAGDDLPSPMEEDHERGG